MARVLCSRDYMMHQVHYMMRWLLLPLTAACEESLDHTSQAPAAQIPVATRATEQASTSPAPQPSAAARELPALQLGRLSYTFEAAELVRRDWPAMTPAQTCLMLVDATAQWVVNCELAPAGFVRTSQRFRDRAVYIHEGGTFSAAGQAHSTAQLLATTPAAAQVPSTSEQSLPGRRPWLVVGSLEALTEFHPSFAHASTEAWVSVVIHELVHTHQLRAPGAERFAEAIVKLERTPAPLTALYLSDARYHAAIEREYALLTRAARANPADKPAARRALKRWRALYEQRIATLPAQLVADDALFSYIEGSARFVESQFLEDPRFHPPAAALQDDPRFDHFKLFVGHGYAGSPNRQLDEHYFYAIGYHLCVLLDRLDPSWRSRGQLREQFLFEIAREVAEAAK